MSATIKASRVFLIQKICALLSARMFEYTVNSVRMHNWCWIHLCDGGVYLSCAFDEVGKLHQRRGQVHRRETERENGEADKKKKKPKGRGGVVGWPVILSPSGTHMKHDGRMRGGIFHCQSEGGMVIHFFLSLSLSIYPRPFLLYLSPFVFLNPPYTLSKQ